MKRDNKLSHAQPRNDYALALQRAVSWLGDRYLLAEPVNKRADDRKTYFAESRSWHPKTG